MSGSRDPAPVNVACVTHVLDAAVDHSSPWRDSSQRLRRVRSVARLFFWGLRASLSFFYGIDTGQCFTAKWTGNDARSS